MTKAMSVYQASLIKMSLHVNGKSTRAVFKGRLLSGTLNTILILPVPLADHELGEKSHVVLKTTKALLRSQVY